MTPRKLRLKIILLFLTLGANLFAQTSTIETQSIGNPRFNFWIDIPKEWTAEDRSANGDGFFIYGADSSLDIRVYGSLRVIDEEEEWAILTKGCKTKDFHFLDGHIGKQISCDYSLSFIRLSKDDLITFYVHGPRALIMSKLKLFETIAKSLRRGKPKIH